MIEIDLRDPGFHPVVAEGARKLGVVPADGAYRYGWGGKSLGVATTSGTWLRVTFRDAEAVNERTWTGEEVASAIVGVRKPALLRSYRWVAGAVVWRVDELSRVIDEPLSATPEATVPMRLPERWWDDLSASLGALAVVRTARVCARQDLVTRRIDAFTGGSVDPTVEVWATAHGDLHWANLVGPSLTILDWEGWGLAPAGLDAATLWAFSLAVPDLAADVERRFADALGARDGRISQLFMCVELIRMSEQFGDHPHLLEPLRAAAMGLRDDLRG